MTPQAAFRGCHEVSRPRSFACLRASSRCLLEALSHASRQWCEYGPVSFDSTRSVLLIVWPYHQAVSVEVCPGLPGLWIGFRWPISGHSIFPPDVLSLFFALLRGPCAV